MDDKKMPHNLILENKQKLTITQVADVDSFSENKIILFISDDTVEIDGYDLHIKKLDVEGGDLSITGEITGIAYTGKEGYSQKNRGLWGKIFK